MSRDSDWSSTQCHMLLSLHLVQRTSATYLLWSRLQLLQAQLGALTPVDCNVLWDVVEKRSHRDGVHLDQ